VNLRGAASGSPSLREDPSFTTSARAPPKLFRLPVLTSYRLLIGILGMLPWWAWLSIPMNSPSMWGWHFLTRRRIAPTTPFSWDMQHFREIAFPWLIGFAVLTFQRPHGREKTRTRWASPRAVAGDCLHPRRETSLNPRHFDVGLIRLDKALRGPALQVLARHRPDRAITANE
jgi:hypothetical protein